MQTYHNTVQEDDGDIITTASVYVYDAGTSTLASLKKADETTAINNPFTLSDDNYDADGSFWFKAANGIYDIKIINGGDTSWKYGRVLFDFSDATTFGGNVSIPDGSWFYAGGSDGVGIRSSGTDGYIDNYLGSLNIRGRVNSAYTYINTFNSAGGSKVCARFGGSTPNSSLYQDGTERLTTTAEGISLSGAANPRLLFQSGDYLEYNSSSNYLTMLIGNSNKLRVDNTATSGNTALRIFDVDNNALEQVTVGVADSGGSGYKVLRIPN